MTHSRTNSNLWWLACLAPMAALPMAIPASVASGVPLGRSLIAWAGVLAFPLISLSLLRRIERWAMKFGRSIAHGIVALAGGATYLLEILAIIGICSLWGMEFTRGPCAFVSQWHYGHLYVPAGLIVFAAILIVVEHRRAHIVPGLEHRERLTSCPA